MSACTPAFPQISGKKKKVILLIARWKGWMRINSLRPSDAIWRHRSGSTLAQIMACCLTAPSHYLNQCWLIINKVQLHSSDDNFTRDISATNINMKIAHLSLTSPRGQWVKSCFVLFPDTFVVTNSSACRELKWTDNKSVGSAHLAR